MRLRRTTKAVAGLGVALALMLTGIMGGCTKTCMENTSSMGIVKFYNSATKATCTWDSTTVYGIGAPGDSVLVNKKSASGVSLPMRINSDTVKYVFKFYSKEALYDTLTIAYKSEPHFASEECGAVYYYNISEYKCTNHSIDSLKFTTMRFTNSDTEKIKLYLNTTRK